MLLQTYIDVPSMIGIMEIIVQIMIEVLLLIRRLSRVE